jgi:hypothetical protein
VKFNCSSPISPLQTGFSITGRLVGAHIGNGQTPVLMVCQSPSASKP